MYIGYIDPGTGSMLISATIALFSVGYFMLKGIIYRKFNIGGDKGQSLDPNHHFGLIFYSEGKQYWNVFKPLLLECEKRGIEATFLTSDKNDPALETEIEGIDIIYIGSGRESYFTMNRLRADVVVMTTPGLDVLELLRSKYVTHYAHIGHATGSVAGYKAYGLDYYDSVLLGGEGDVEVIRTLESLRNLPKKDIEIIGHTYLDVYRDILSVKQYEYTMFESKRTTILVSPTWSNHGLLAKNGKSLLKALVAENRYNIIIRPHPQSLLIEKEMLDELMELFPNGPNMVWDMDVENLKAMSHADIMISDFSGIVFDFFTLFKKPILTISGLYEKRGRDAMDLSEDPWDVKMLSKIGSTITMEDTDKMPTLIDEIIEYYAKSGSTNQSIINMIDKRPNESAVRGIDFIEETLSKISKGEQSIETEKYESTEQVFTGTILSNQGSWLKNFIYGLINPQIIFQVMMSSVLLTTYIYFGLRLIPVVGLNTEFYSKMLPRLMLLTVALFALSSLTIKIFNKGRMVFIAEKEHFDAKDLLLTALPLTPIIIYILANQDILNFFSSLKVFGYFFLISTLFIVVLPWFLSPLLSKNFSMPVGISLLYVTFNMASFGRETSIKVIVLFLIGICIGSFLLLFVNQKRILITISILLIIANFTVNFTVGKKQGELPTDPNSKLLTYIEGKKPSKIPDVYILIYDSYANQETMDQYGYDNSEQITYLLNEDFIIYDGTYSTHAASLSTMSHVLNASFINNNFVDYRKNIAGEADGFKAFRKNEYYMQSVQESDYMTKGVKPLYDKSYPNESAEIAPHKIIIDAIKEGEFRFDVEFSKITYEDYVEAKLDALNTKQKAPKFLYTHSNYPGHSQNSGVLRPNETALHIERLEIANKSMREDIAAIRSQNKEAIIVVAGDHGPYLTKNGVDLTPYELSEIDQLDVQDRYGTFLAISWPEQGMKDKYDIQIVQDTIPAILSYMYNDDLLFDSVRMEQVTYDSSTTGGVRVKDGVIQNGKDEGKPLFTIKRQRKKE